MKKQLKTVLHRVTEELQDAGIPFAVGSSVLLYLYGLETDPGDIDLFFPGDREEEVRHFFQTRGTLTYPRPREPYRTGFFYQIRMDGADLDLIGDFGVGFATGSYRLIWEEPRPIFWEGRLLPVLPLEQWLIFYRLMGRPERARRIAGHLGTHGLERPEIFIRALADALPPALREEIQRLLKDETCGDTER